MQKDVSERLPDSQTGNETTRDKTEKVIDPRECGGAANKIRKHLDKKNTSANEDEELDAGSDESTPVEVVTPRAEGTSHQASLRRSVARVKVPMAQLIELLAGEIEE